MCLLEYGIKMVKNLKSYIENEKDNIWVYILMGWILGWA